MEIEKTPIFNKAYDIVHSWITEKDTIDTENILDLTVKVITLVQKISNDKGDYKKNLVICLIKKLVREIEYETEEIRKKVLEFIDKTLPHFIDISISLAKGDINIGKKLKTIEKECFSLFGKLKPKLC